MPGPKTPSLGVIMIKLPRPIEVKTDELKTGMMKFFGDTYGIITQDDGGEDVLAHGSNGYTDITENSADQTTTFTKKSKVMSDKGDRVIFKEVQGPNGLMAIPWAILRDKADSQPENSDNPN